MKILNCAEAIDFIQEHRIWITPDYTFPSKNPYFSVFPSTTEEGLSIHSEDDEDVLIALSKLKHKMDGGK